jgi:hypothetical protein
MKTITIIEFYGRNDFIESNCNSISFTRPLGTNAVYVNGLPIADGQTFSINQNTGDVDHTKYEIVFQNTGGSGNELYVVKIRPTDTPELY